MRSSDISCVTESDHDAAAGVLAARAPLEPVERPRGGSPRAVRVAPQYT